MLRDWHKLGMRGLRFHLFPHKFEYVRGVSFDVFEAFRTTMADLGWVMQIFCDHRTLAGAASYLREVSGQMPVIVDHLGMVPASAGVEDANFQALLGLVGDGHVHVKLSTVYRLSERFPDYADARPLHDALIRANPERLMWGTTGRIHRLPPRSCPTTAICSTCYMIGCRTRKRAVASWLIRRRGCSRRNSMRDQGWYPARHYCSTSVQPLSLISFSFVLR